MIRGFGLVLVSSFILKPLILANPFPNEPYEIYPLGIRALEKDESINLPIYK